MTDKKMLKIAENCCYAVSKRPNNYLCRERNSAQVFKAISKGLGE